MEILKHKLTDRQILYLGIALGGLAIGLIDILTLSMKINCTCTNLVGELLTNTTRIVRII
jgi:hypothetical protein